MTRLYGVNSAPDEHIPGWEYLTIWSGAYMSDFEGWAAGVPGSSTVTIVLEYNGAVNVTLPEGVTFPRTDETYTAIDAAINEAINAHLAKLSIPDLPPGDDGTPTIDDVPAPGADDRDDDRIEDSE